MNFKSMSSNKAFWKIIKPFHSDTDLNSDTTILTVQKQNSYW